MGDGETDEGREKEIERERKRWVYEERLRK